VQMDEFGRGISRYRTFSVLSSCSSEKVLMQTNKSGDAINFYSESTWHKSRSIVCTDWEIFLVSTSRDNFCR